MLHSLFGGHETAWQTWGEKGPKVLMIHCSLAHSGAWQGVAARLSRHAEIRAYDLPGHGRSGAWHPGEEYQEQAMEMAIGLIRDWGEDPVHVVGHSFGGTVALRLAVEHPELVASLTLYEPVFFTAGFQAFPELKAEHDAEMAGYADAFAAGDYEGAARAFMRVWGDGRSWDSLPEAQRQGFIDRIQLIDAIKGTNYGDPGAMLAQGRLRSLSCPVLLMEGAESPVYVARINDALQMQIPDAERVVLQGAAHMGPVTHAAAVAAELQDFLKL